MRIAQRLYEGVDIGGETVGLITYMRTDGIDMAPEAISAARRVIAKEYGERYLPGVPRKYQNKAKNAQEAHEAIRPTDMGRLPAHVRRHLEPEQAKLYELIWVRTVASQMESAELERTTVDIAARVGPRNLELRATGQVIKFDGFLTLYREDRDDPDPSADGEDEEGRLPPMSAGDSLERRRIEATQHFTEPPPRYSEASLVKRMEELGIGRPSTYASILAVLREREYVRLEKKRLVAEDKGLLVIAFLESFFKKLVEYDFTADLEEKLDRISNHEIDWKAVLREFWRDFSAAVGETKELRTGEVLDALNELLAPHIFPAKADGGDPRACPNCGNGQLSLRLGKFGAFIGCSNYPECRYTRQLMAAGGAEAESGFGDEGTPGVKLLGEDPESGLPVTLRDGRFGVFLQLGEAVEKGDKPKRSSLPPGVSPDSVDLDRALQLLALPRPVATHPETGEPILVGIGRYGPYVQHGKTYANLERDDDVLSVGANRAIDLIVAKETGGNRFRRGNADPGRALGEDPASGKAVVVKGGRFGPYVTDGEINATLPKAVTQEAVTLDEALALIAARRASGATGKKGRFKKAGGAKKTATKKTPAKKAAAKKSPAKKTAAKKPAAKRAAG
jgi:DNA topoisomerase-1